jgi:hypothetical protein
MIDHHPYQLVDLSLTFSARFWLFFFSFLLSIICCLFVLYHLLFDRVLRRTLNNHVIIVLLFNTLLYQLTSIPLHLSYYFLSTVWPAAPQVCLIWMFIDGGLFTLALILVAWASIERYILIFHDKWMATRKKRFFVHYLPLVVIFVYCFLFHAVTMGSRNFANKTFVNRTFANGERPMYFRQFISCTFANWRVSIALSPVYLLYIRQLANVH